MSKTTTLLNYTFFAIILFSTVLLTSGCQQSSKNNSSEEKLQVTASFYPMYYFAKEIGGEYADVTNLTPAGTEPHDYELTPQDVVAIQNSDLLVLNGGQLEVWADDITEDLPRSTIVVTAGQAVIDRTMEEDAETISDPHVWLSPQFAQVELQAIVDGFIAADPSHATEYTANAQKLETSLTELDTQYTQGLKNCASTDIITSHTAFSYLASEYNLNQVAITGLSPDQEPSPTELAKVVQFAQEHNVQYIFFESLVSPKLSETIAEEVGAQTLVLNPIEGLSDEEISQGKTYISVMQDNLTNLRTALQCL